MGSPNCGWEHGESNHKTEEHERRQVSKVRHKKRKEQDSKSKVMVKRSPVQKSSYIQAGVQFLKGL